MRNIYRAFFNRVGTDAALLLAHDLDRWHSAMVPHRQAIMSLGFAPDGHPSWEDCPHAEARKLWDRAVQLLGSRAGELELLRTCSLAPVSAPSAVARQPWPIDGRRVDHGSAGRADGSPAPAKRAAA